MYKTMQESHDSKCVMELFIVSSLAKLGQIQLFTPRETTAEHCKTLEGKTFADSI